MKKKINGLSVFLEGDKKNRAIIFLHGFPYSSLIWQSQIEALSSNYYCIAYDIRGLGDSAIGDGQYTMESFVDDLKTVIRKLKIEKPPILCSFSMGGYIALRALERIEKAFSAVILCDTVSYADTNEVKLKRANAIKNINRKGLSSFVRTFIINCYTSSYIEKNKEFVDKSIENSLKFSSIGIKGCLLAIMTRSDTTEYLKSIQIPTLLLCGEYDTLTSASSMLTMARQIKGSEFVIIKNAAHMSIIENPVACNNAIKEFLSKIEEKV